MDKQWDDGGIAGGVMVYSDTVIDWIRYVTPNVCQ